jgi:hypothetical protein
MAESIEQSNNLKIENNEMIQKNAISNFDPLYHKAPKYDIYRQLVFFTIISRKKTKSSLEKILET